MFQLSKEEAESSRSQFATLNDGSDNLKSQFATSSEDSSRSQFATLNGRGPNIKHLPYAFTENGIAMLSGVLRSPMAIATNIHIMRAFNAMRHFIGSHAQVFQRLEVVERNQLALTTQVAENNKKLEEVFRRLDDRSEKPEKGIFFDGQIFDAYTFINERIREAKKRIVLIDNYVDDSVLTMLDKQFDRAHDRFLCIDDTVYLIGASLKDLGKKWFGFVKLEQPTDELLSKM